MARLLVEIDEGLKRDLKVRLMREGETLKEWIARMAEIYVEGAIPPAYAETVTALRETREPQSGMVVRPLPAPPTERPPKAAPKKDDIFFFD